MSYAPKNYFTDGGDTLVIGGKMEFASADGSAKGLMPNQAADSSGTTASLKASFNALLTKLKNAGLMTGDTLSVSVTKCSAESDSGNANRAYNTGKVDSVSIADNVITITLASGTKVADLKDFEAGNGWGKHKWLGIGITAGMALTSLYYNGAALTEDDATEASRDGGLSSNYFVRWVAADLVFAGNNTERTKDTFTLWADGYARTAYTLKVVEGATA